MHLGLRDPNSFPPTALLSLGLGPRTLAGPLYTASGWGKREWTRYSGFFFKKIIFYFETVSDLQKSSKNPDTPFPQTPLTACAKHPSDVLYNRKTSSGIMSCTHLPWLSFYLDVEQLLSLSLSWMPLTFLKSFCRMCLRVGLSILPHD